MALLTAAQARAIYLPGVTSASDTDIDTVIARSDALLASWLGWAPPTDGGRPTLESASHTIYLDGPSTTDPAVLVLPLYPVTAVASIYDDELLVYGSSTQVASSQWVLDQSRGRVRLLPTASHAWSTAPRAIKVTCTAGFVAATHLDAVEALGRQVHHAWTLRDVQGLVSGSRPGGASITYREQGEVCREARDALGRYRVTLGM